MGGGEERGFQGVGNVKENIDKWNPKTVLFVSDILTQQFIGFKGEKRKKKPQ